ncbi:MAG: pYEATS domain-containing protein [Arenicellales bacterium]
MDCVEYTLHPTFPGTVRKLCDSTNGFELSSSGWGTFNVKIKVMFKDGRTKKLNHMLIF